MQTRDGLVDAFLAQTPWADWARTPLAGDASSRRYIRLTSGDAAVIIMDAPPAANATTTSQFADIAHYLANAGLCPPEIHAHDPKTGIMVISDLGPHDFAGWLNSRPQDAALLYRAATDVILHLQSCDPPAALAQMTPDIGATMIQVTCDYYARCQGDDLRQAVNETMQELAPVADTVALRDYHAENLIWRPQHSSLARVGRLDFQDAFVAPKGYDLMSLLRDVRRDVEPALTEMVIDDYLTRSGLPMSFRAQLACLGAQRNLRILGVFAYLAKAKNKPRYLDLMDRVWRNLQADLAHPALEALRHAVDNTLPVPTTAHLQSLRP